MHELILEEVERAEVLPVRLLLEPALTAPIRADVLALLRPDGSSFHPPFRCAERNGQSFLILIDVSPLDVPMGTRVLLVNNGSARSP